MNELDYTVIEDGNVTRTERLPNITFGEGCDYDTVAKVAAGWCVRVVTCSGHTVEMKVETSRYNEKHKALLLIGTLFGADDWNGPVIGVDLDKIERLEVM